MFIIFVNVISKLVYCVIYIYILSFIFINEIALILLTYIYICSGDGEIYL
jgi:hypothetical protein